MRVLLVGLLVMAGCASAPPRKDATVTLQPVYANQPYPPPVQK